MENLQVCPSREPLVEAEAQLDESPQEEELCWRQRCRELWLTEGDRNTRWFHTKASMRRKCNRIHGLYDCNNIWQEDLQAVLGILTDYFSNIFTSSGPSENDFEAVLREVTPRIDD